MCPGQPHVQRHDTRLRAHAYERSQRDRYLQPRAGADTGRPPDRSGVREQQYGNPRTRATEMCDRHVREHRVTRLLVTAPPDENQRRRQQRHHLPREQERQWVARAYDPRHRENEPAGDGGDRPPSRVRLEVAQREDQGRQRDKTERAQEQPTQTVDAELRIERAREAFAERRARPEDPESGNRHAGRACGLQRDANPEPTPHARHEPTQRNRAQPGDDQGAAHEVSRSRKIDCCSASWRLMIPRPAASKSKTRSSSTR